jgi:hypothetical protein
MSRGTLVANVTNFLFFIAHNATRVHDVNREAEPKRPSRVACSDLLADFSGTILLSITFQFLNNLAAPNI